MGKIGGPVGYWLNEISFIMDIMRLDVAIRDVKNIPIPFDQWTKHIEDMKFGLKQIKFMCYMMGWISKPKENPNEVLMRHQEYIPL